MNTASRIPSDTSPTGWHSLLRRPRTRLGWWSVGLAATSVVLNLINSPILTRLIGSNLWRVRIGLPFSFVMLSCGLAAGIVGVVALIRQHEHSLFVWLALIPGLGVVLFVLGEFLVPH